MSLPRLFIDADACPVKDEVYRVGARYGLHVFVVSNSWINTPRETWIEQVVVDAGPDIADDWIAERVGPGDIVITAVRFRTQERNRADAVERLQAMVDKASVAPVYRVPTRPTRASKERRLEGKAKRSTIKSGRGKPGLSD